MKFSALMMSAILALSVIAGCAATPTAKEQVAVAVVVNIAAGRAIQRSDTDTAVWAARATEYKTIAVQIREASKDSNATVATLGLELRALVAKNLGPANQIAANAVIAAVTPYLQQEAADHPNVANVTARLSYMLDQFIMTCDAYGAT